MKNNERIETARTYARELMTRYHPRYLADELGGVDMLRYATQLRWLTMRALRLLVLVLVVGGVAGCADVEVDIPPCPTPEAQPIPPTPKPACETGGRLVFIVSCGNGISGRCTGSDGSVIGVDCTIGDVTCVAGCE